MVHAPLATELRPGSRTLVCEAWVVVPFSALSTWKAAPWEHTGICGQVDAPSGAPLFGGRDFCGHPRPAHARLPDGIRSYPVVLNGVPRSTTCEPPRHTARSERPRTPPRETP